MKEEACVKVRCNFVINIRIYLPGLFGKTFRNQAIKQKSTVI